MREHGRLPWLLAGVTPYGCTPPGGGALADFEQRRTRQYCSVSSRYAERASSCDHPCGGDAAAAGAVPRAAQKAVCCKVLRWRWFERVLLRMPLMAQSGNGPLENSTLAAVDCLCNFLTQ